MGCLLHCANYISSQVIVQMQFVPAMGLILLGVASELRCPSHAKTVTIDSEPAAADATLAVMEAAKAAGHHPDVTAS
jgi:hypothetical protein